MSPGLCWVASETFRRKPGENPDTIFENFCYIISDLGGGFPKEKLEGIGMAFPGLLIMNRASA